MTSEAVEETTSSPTSYVARNDDLSVVLPSQRPLTVWPDEENDTGGSADSRDISAITESASHSIATPRVIPAPPPPPLPYHFDLRQQWEGTVVAIEKNEFRASLKDLTNPDNPPEEVTFSTEELYAGDHCRLVPGAVFRWSIGYKTQGSQKERVSRIQFARLPGWSKRAVERVEAHAAELQRLFSETGSVT